MNDEERKPYQDEFNELKRKREEAKFRIAVSKAIQAEKHRKVKDDLKDEEEEQKQAKTKTSEGLNLKRIRPENVRKLVPVGSVAYLQGLSSDEALNGEMCEILKYDAAGGRYLVNVLNGAGEKRVRPDHLNQSLPVAELGVAVVVNVVERGFRQAQIESYDPVEKRYRVCLLGSQDTLECDAPQVQLCFAADDVVLLHSLQSLPKLNGKEVVVKGFDDEKGRYIVQLDDKSDCMRIRPECVQERIGNGVRVMIDGLEKAKDLNGTQAVIEDYESATGRYILRVGGEVEKKEKDATTLWQPNRAWMKAGVAVTVRCVAKSPEKMGQQAVVEGIDEEIRHYLLRFIKTLKADYMKPEHVCQYFAPESKIAIQNMATLSGQLATVERFEPMKGIYFVRLANTQVRQMKPENMCVWFETGSRVVLVGLDHVAQLDGQIAKVDGFDHDRGKYLVRLLKNKKRRSLLRPEHLRQLWPVGTVVRLDGLQSAIELNGQYGKVQSFDKSCSRYLIRQYSNSVIARVRSENVFITLPGEAPDDPEDVKETCSSCGHERYSQDDEFCAHCGMRFPKKSHGEDDTSSVDSGDILDQLPAPGSPACSSTSSSSDSLGRRGRKRRQIQNTDGLTPKIKIPHCVLRTAVEKNMKAGYKDVKKCSVDADKVSAGSTADPAATSESLQAFKLHA